VGGIMKFRIILTLALVFVAITVMLGNKPDATIKPDVVCVRFIFPDGLRPGQEARLIGPVGLNGAGIHNVDDKVQFDRQLCFTQEIHPDAVRILTRMAEAGRKPAIAAPTPVTCEIGLWFN
jgi:hypothetical protein